MAKPKSRKSPEVRFDTEPSKVTGQALHVRPIGGDGRLHVGITYPVSIGGGPVETRELVIVLDPSDRDKLAEFLGSLS